MVTVQLQFTLPNEEDNMYVKETIDKKLHEVSVLIGDFVTIAEAYQNKKGNEKSVQEALKKVRLAYKEVESVTSFYFPEHDKFYINGAPLYHIEPYPTGATFEKKNYYVFTPEEYKNTLVLDKMEGGHYLEGTSKVIAPVGLQRLDEIIFTEEVVTEQDRILVLAQDLKTKFSILEKELNRRKYYQDFEIMEFTRLELIRILTKGITGFDTPGSLNGIQESASALEGIEDILHPYLNKCNLNDQKKIETLFKNSRAYLLKHTNFNNFDRLVFIKNYLNPLYKELLLTRKQLEIPSVAERYGQTPSWNANSENFFDEDFLNPYYYSMLKKKEDSPELRAVGKKLFYDGQLSDKGTLSCATCHQPKLGYADGQRTSFAGIPGKRLERNSPTLINAVFSDKYFYDLRANDLEDQAEHVIESHMEFNTSFEDIVAKLNADAYYVNAFKKIYNTNTITKYEFSAALASYIISLRSFNSEFDKYMRGETDKLDRKVKKGFNLFMGKANCATCHYVPTFSGLVPPLYNENESEVLGVMEVPEELKMGTDFGRYENGVNNENVAIYKYSFKTVTVRNVALTAPYFHNGAYKSLDEVLEFYNRGGAQGVGLTYEVPNQTLAPDHLNLSKSDIEAIKAFMESLTSVPVDN
ncbi:cytochrome-c peroxidase [Neptunitalea chrysea]|uniref:Cytochrome-c peroxidase n=2 Tax=Neptunitalea chrysea TaxID=1647581 RepID=A0A9W6B5J0_9FLAO|nr:cytochrome-c peroxidase [Neptunitalea chrysea]